MKNLFIGILLFLVSSVPVIVLTLVSFPLVVVYYIITLRWLSGLSAFGKHLSKIALAFDQLGNVSLAPITNIVMVKKGTSFHPYGDEDDTLSYVVAMNNRKRTLSKFGYRWVKLLERIDPGHMRKSIEAKNGRDMEAIERLKSNGYLK